MGFLVHNSNEEFQAETLLIPKEESRDPFKLEIDQRPVNEAKVKTEWPIPHLVQK